MQLLSMDYFSLPKVGRFKSVLVIVDYFTRFTWAYKFEKDNGASTISALSDLFEHYGCPTVLLSDNGSHLNSKEVNAFCERHGVERRTTPVYSPNTNGLVERTNGLLLSALERACAPRDADGTTQKWPSLLHKIVNQLNNRVVSTTGARPSDLLFGYERFPTLAPPPADDLLAEALDTVVDRRLETILARADGESRADAALATLVKNQGIRKERADARNAAALRGASAASSSELKRGDLVWLHASHLTMQLNHKLQQEWRGPFRIVARGSDVRPDLSIDDAHATNVTFWLDDPTTGQPLAAQVHANRLKRYLSPAGAGDAAERFHPLPSLTEFFGNWEDAVEQEQRGEDEDDADETGDLREIDLVNPGPANPAPPAVALLASPSSSAAARPASRRNDPPPRPARSPLRPSPYTRA